MQIIKKYKENKILYLSQNKIFVSESFYEEIDLFD